jgi:hypothetical protein
MTNASDPLVLDDIERFVSLIAPPARQDEILTTVHAIAAGSDADYFGIGETLLQSAWRFTTWEVSELVNGSEDVVRACSELSCTAGIEEPFHWDWQLSDTGSMDEAFWRYAQWLDRRGHRLHEVESGADDIQMYFTVGPSQRAEVCSLVSSLCAATGTEWPLHVRPDEPPRLLKHFLFSA